MEFFEAGVEPENIGSRRCLPAARVRPRSDHSDFEGISSYRASRRA